MSEVLKKKQAIVADITDKLENSHSVIFVDYRGLTVAEDTELRSKFREQGVEYQVLKNTMISRAADNLKMEDLKPFLSGPTAVAFGMEDAVAPAKIISDFIKETKKGEIKCGVLDGAIIGTDKIKTLADMPPREVLITKALGSMNAPISNFVGVLSATMRSLLYALNAVGEQKGE